MKIIVVYIFCLLFTNLSFTQIEINSVQKAINDFCSSEELADAAISFMAYNLEDSVVIAEVNPRISIPAASITKLFTTATAFEVLGENFRPKTLFYRNGEVDSNGILHGDIIVRSFGDPSLGSRFFYNKEEANSFLETWVEKILKSGIKKISGRIIVDGSAFGYNGAPDGWVWSDLGNYYGAGPSASVVYDNTVFLHFSTENKINGATFIDSLTPPIPGLKIDNRVKTYKSSSDNAYIYGTPYSFDRFAIGFLPHGKSNFEVKSSVPDSELLLAQTFENALREAEIDMYFPAIGWRLLRQENDTLTLDYKTTPLLFSYEGKSVKEIAYWTNLRSINLFAEQLLSIIGYNKAGYGTTRESADYLKRYWEPRIGMKLYQTDGSGLSRSNGFSALHFIKLLDYMYHSKNFDSFEATLPIAGKSGTLRSVCRGQAAQDKMKAKSGTMTKIKSYSGYIDSKGGKKIGFALIVNNYDLTNYEITKKMEPVFNAIANYE